MMGHRERLITGDEYDAIMARRMYLYLQRARRAHDIKKDLSRRNRRITKARLNYEYTRED